MYIPAFWVGVVTTVLVEIIGLSIAFVISEKKKKKNRRNKP